MDGYFLYLGNNFYIIGEWFLGSIIILYLLYPLLRYLLINNAFISSILFFLLFIHTTFYDIFLVSDYRNLFTCIFCFWMGMIFEKNRTFFIKNNHIILIFCTIALFFAQKIIKSLYYTIFLSVFIFILIFLLTDLLQITNKFYKFSILNNTIFTISKYSYSLFLVHHVVIRVIMKKFSNSYLSSRESFVLLLTLFLIIFIFSIAVFKLEKYIFSFFDKPKEHLSFQN